MNKLAAVALAALSALSIVLMSEPVVLYGRVTHIYHTPDVSPAIYR